MYDDWFDDEGANGQHKAFLAVIRESARMWPECRPDDTVVLLFPDPDDEDQQFVAPHPSGYAGYDAALHHAFVVKEPVLEAIVYLVDFGGNLRLKVLGATLVGTKLICMERNDNFWPEPSEDVQTLEATGSPEELGRIAADWFEEVVRRPVISTQRPPRAWDFATPATPLPPGHRWARNGPR
ncbi:MULTISPECIES: hypothetical protein [unclassified Streptomyces]|uniref:hypothetical protein n=1 Tax=unclassified Streptomyces TaxID=2593676 RepID=UPI0038007361